MQLPPPSPPPSPPSDDAPDDMLIAMCICTACNADTITDAQAEHHLCITCRLAAAYPIRFGDCPLCSLPFTTDPIDDSNGITCSICIEAMNLLLMQPPSPQSPVTDDAPDELEQPNHPYHPADWFMCPGCIGLYHRVPEWPALPWSDITVHPSPIIGQIQSGTAVPLVDASDVMLPHVLVVAWCRSCYTMY